MGRHKGADDNARNRMIIDLRKKGKSYNQITREIERSGFVITVQRVQQIIKQGLLTK